MSDLIFGYTWEEIQAAQQGRPLHRIIQTNENGMSTSTIYQCCKQGKDVNKTPQVVHCEPTEALAIKWLENNGGGIYKNILHNFQYYVPPKYC